MKNILIILTMLYVHSNASGQAMRKEPVGDPASAIKHGSLITEYVNSVILQANRIGVDANRSVTVFLPPGYAGSGKSYPVVYYCHSIFSSPGKLFDEGQLVNLLERGFAEGVVKEFIFVAADYSTATAGSVYENSPISGRWLDFTVKELVPFIDRKFRTIRDHNSRAVAGDFMGGRGALKLAMINSDIFGSVYALHPVATGMGDIPWSYLNIDWKEIHRAKSLNDVSDGRARLFVSLSQAFLPNPERPPFYCDFFMEMENGVPTFHVEHAQKMKSAFLLDETLNEAEKSLRSLRGIAFDWGRFDETLAHVTSNREFSRKLQDLGIEHEAEEYAGNPSDKTWTDNGRFYTRVLPFLARHLVFEEK